MKKIRVLSGVLALAAILLLPAAVFATVPVTKTINVGNIGDGVTGRTDHGFCEAGSENEWHFVIIDLTPEAPYPAYVTAVFSEGTVQIPFEKVTGNAIHYRVADLYLDWTLTASSAEIDINSTYKNFNLSHAPCGSGGGGGGGQEEEVGGVVSPVDKAGLVIPVVAGITVFLSVAFIVGRRLVIK